MAATAEDVIRERKTREQERQQRYESDRKRHAEEDRVKAEKFDKEFRTDIADLIANVGPVIIEKLAEQNYRGGELTRSKGVQNPIKLLRKYTTLDYVAFNREYSFWTIGKSFLHYRCPEDFVLYSDGTVHYGLYGRSRDEWYMSVPLTSLAVPSDRSYTPHMVIAIGYLCLRNFGIQRVDESLLAFITSTEENWLSEASIEFLKYVNKQFFTSRWVPELPRLV